MPVPKRKRSDQPSPLFQLRTMDAVIDALGGDAGVKKLTGAAQNNLGNWRKTQKKFPAHTYLIMIDALAERGYRAPPALWGITEP